MGAPRPRRILAVKLSSLGDIVLVTASLRALRRAHPDADLRVAVESRFAPLLAACPWIDGVLEAPSRDVRGLRYLALVRARLAQARAGAGAFDLALDFQGTRRSAAWVYLSGARVRAGRGGWRPGWRATVAADHGKHAVRGYADVCALAGIAADDLDPALQTSARDDASLQAILARMGLPARGFALLNTASGWASKSWDASRAAGLASRVADATGRALLVTGGEDERAYAERVAALARPGAAVPLAGGLTLGEALCLYRRARLMITCDSGPMHAAAALGTPVVALFGPTHPEHTGPRGPGHVVLQASRPRDHHAYRRDADASHMRALDLDRVADAVLAALRAAPARVAEEA
jgi:ADP-heptose:LPS heptosyltransferase